jgi:hypothetical protein
MPRKNLVALIFVWHGTGLSTRPRAVRPGRAVPGEAWLGRHGGRGPAQLGGAKED